MKIQKELWKNDKKDEVFMSNKKNLEKLNSQFFLVLENKNATDEIKLKKIKYLARLGGDVDCVDEKGNPLLKVAIKNCGKEIAEWLLDNGANKNRKDKNLRTPLMIAARYGKPEIVELLCKRGVRVEKTDFVGETALMGAVVKNDEKCVKILLENGASPDTRAEGSLRTALMIATDLGRHNIMKILIENDAEVNLDDCCDTNALMLGVKNKDVQAVKILLENGAMVNLGDDRDESALYKAVMEGDEEIFQLLYDRGGNIEKQNVDGDTLLMGAYRIGDEWMVANLESLGANREARNYMDEDILIMAIKGGNVSLIKKAIKNGAKVNRVYGVSCSTPLMCACASGKVELVKALVEEGAKLETKVGKTESSVFEVLISENNTFNKYGEVVKYLLSKGCKVKEEALSKARDMGYGEDVIEMINKAVEDRKNKSFLGRLKNYGRV